MARRIAPYGTWESPITSDLVSAGTISLSEPAIDGEDIYWIEGRPAEGGRNVLMRHGSQETEDVTPPPFNVRTRVHEYGGGAYLVRDGTVYFSNFADNRVYRQTVGESPQPLTPDGPWRYADFELDPLRRRLIAVREDHSGDGEAVNSVVAIDLNSGAQTVLLHGNDFYAAPRLHPSGRQLSWLTWHHPNMPWDGSELWAGTLDDAGAVTETRVVAGGDQESVFAPQWSPDGNLVFALDRTGWWNLYRDVDGRVEPIAPMEAEFGRPQWRLGASTFAIPTPETIVCVYTQGPSDTLALLHVQRGTVTPLDVPYTSMSDVRATGGTAVFIGESPAQTDTVVRLDLTTGQWAELRGSTPQLLPAAYVPEPEGLDFEIDGRTVHAVYFPPHNPDFAAPADDLPPLIVQAHGGPTGRVSTALSLDTAFWTSRGFAVIAVNYGGSTGYGRAYRDSLKGRWGVLDVEDCAAAARYLIDRGLAHPDRAIIRGGSAGGYTTLASLATTTTYGAGSSHFGIADLDPFFDHTHKFESRYTESLVGPYPERADLYRERSPINYLDDFSAPVILFQGLDDKIVPPDQAEIMVEGLRRNALPFAYAGFAGEGHGFRAASSIKRVLDAEQYFFSRVFGWDVPEEAAPVEIEGNL